MDEPILRSVRNNLNAKFYATNDTWLKDCVEYYLSKHNNPSNAEVLEFVISQWQLSDLREISCEKPSLPKNLAQEKCTTLRGHFILQMEKVYDIAESKYKQLEKIRNVCTDNIQTTETEATQAWEPKKKRMLQLHLTDGAQDVTAIEYKPIRFLTDKLLPGYKLMIKGPVTCRRGVIMLNETNISEIGGEVETLLIPNATENVLARALNLPENPDPYNDNLNVKPAEDVLFDDDFDIDMNAVEQIERRSQEESTNVSDSRTPSTNSNTQSNSASSRTTYRDVQPQRELVEDAPRVSLVERAESDLLFDMIDENEFEDIQEVVQPPRVASKTVSRPSVRTLPRESEFPDDDDDLILITDDANFSNVNTWQKRGSDARPASRMNDISKLKIDENAKPLATPPTKQATALTPNQSVQAGNKRTASVLSPPVLKPPAEKVRCTLNTPKSNKTNNRKITDYLKKDDHSIAVPSNPKICDNISDLLTVNVTQNDCKTVRGKLDNFDKLGRNGDCWQLNATIVDATGTIEVAFSSEILEKALGFNVAEFKLKKKLKKTNPEIENQLRQGFRSAENKLKNLDALLVVELAPGQKPKIVEIKDLFDEKRQM